MLVALVVLSIGFLGFAALEEASLSTNNSAMARSMATIASYEILDDMRADATNARAGNYNQTVKTSACPASGTTLASVQINKWCSQLASNLGSSTSNGGAVNCSSTGSCTVTVNFTDRVPGAGSASSAALSIATTATL